MKPTSFERIQTIATKHKYSTTILRVVLPLRPIRVYYIAKITVEMVNPPKQQIRIDERERKR